LLTPVAPLIENIVYKTDGSSREFTRRSATHSLNSRLTRPLFGAAAWIGVRQAKFVAGDVVRCGGFHSTRDDDRVVYRVAFQRRAERRDRQ
jgi:hypothetical protein